MMWKFRELQPTEPERDPHEAEFFRLSHASEAVVREFIQNSLDAKAPASDFVRVRFVLGSVPKSRLERFLGPEFKEHLRASHLLPADYQTEDPIPFLAMEDYGTTGLDGETGEEERPQGRHNFYNFWWWEGKSEKKGHDAGRWGLGKTTFHMISKLRAFWGFTIRIDDGRKLLLGKVLLRAHRIQGHTYDYRGYYAQDGRKPIDITETIDQFTNTFSISRTGEPGLSLVIPMPEVEIDTYSVIRFVIIHYFYAIMSGRLTVEIDGAEGKIHLDSANLTEMAIEQDWKATAWENVNIPVFLRFVKDSIDNKDFFALPDECAERLEIDERSFGERLETLRANFGDMTFIAIRVPVFVQELNKRKVKSYVDVYLRKVPSLKAPHEYYIRSGITIADIKNLGSRQVKALFVADDPVITTFLGDAETPAHTKWVAGTEGFKKKYVNAAETLKFISKSLLTIVSILDEPPKERQIDFLKDVFSVPVTEDDESDDPTTKKRVPPIDPRRKTFEIIPIHAGLRVKLVDNGKELPFRGKLKLAYDVRRGNPFKQYEPSDFDVSHRPIAVDTVGCNLISAHANVVGFEITSRDFSLSVRGFDPKRDLVADVKEQDDEA
jgi:hypothetical protein